MKKLFFIVALCLATFLNAKVNTIVSIVPQKLFVEKIGGDKVDVKLMVKAGNSPHTYEPKPSQMRDISKADVYFSIGVEFEEAWLPRFINQNKKMKIIDISKNIDKIEIAHHEEEHNEHHNHGEEGKDPHIWLSPKNVKIIAKNIYEYLLHVDPKNKSYYKNNFDKFLKEISDTDKKIKDILSDKKPGNKFMVFHPSWGYFAKDYNLEQITVEIAGKTPTPKSLIHIIEEAKEENIKAIFIQPEFSDKTAKTLARELKIEVIKTSPLDENWAANLENLAKAIK